MTNTLKSMECPHCHEAISRNYAVKALVMLAKSEGLDFSEELQALLPAEAFEPAEGSANKAVSGSTNYAGNQTASSRGKAPGSFVPNSRAGAKKVERANKPTNYTNEGGMAKSLFDVVEGHPQLVHYGYGNDAQIAEAMAKGAMGQQPNPNLRAERETATGELTAE